MSATTAPNCPECGKPLQKVKQGPGSLLNAEQFDAVRCGDWFCDVNSDGMPTTSYRYFWDSDLAASPVQGAASAVEVLAKRLTDMGAKKFSFTPGSNPDATPEQIAGEINKALDQIESGTAASASDQGAAKAFKRALDAAYPKPDSPHTSVQMRATDDRAAFKRGWGAALAERVQAAQPTGAVALNEPKPCRQCDASVGYVCEEHGDAADESDAYNYACELMEQFQAERARIGVEIGTQGSLCDGIAWLFSHIKKLESATPAPEQEAAPLDRKPTLIQACEEGNDRESPSWFEIHANSVGTYREEGYRVRCLYEDAAPVEQEAVQVVAKADDPSHVMPRFAAPAGQHDAAAALLADFVEFHTSPAGMTPAVIEEGEAFAAQMADIDRRQADLIARAKAIITPTKPQSDYCPECDTVRPFHMPYCRTLSVRATATNTNQPENLGAANTNKGGEA